MNTDTKAINAFIPFEEIIGHLENAVDRLQAQGTPESMFGIDTGPDDLNRRAVILREFRTIGFHAPRQCGATSYIERSLTKRSLVIVRHTVMRSQLISNFQLDKKCDVLTLRDVLNMDAEQMLRVHQRGAYDRVFLDEASYMFNAIKNSHIQLYDVLAQITVKDCVVVRVN